MKTDKLTITISPDGFVIYEIDDQNGNTLELGFSPEHAIELAKATAAAAMVARSNQPQAGAFMMEAGETAQ
jgi:hypothetical protein